MSGTIKAKCDETLTNSKSDQNTGRLASALNITGSVIRYLPTPGADLVGGAICLGAKALSKVLNQKQRVCLNRSVGTNICNFYAFTYVQ